MVDFQTLCILGFMNDKKVHWLSRKIDALSSISMCAIPNSKNQKNVQIAQKSLFVKKEKKKIGICLFFSS